MSYISKREQKFNLLFMTPREQGNRIISELNPKIEEIIKEKFTGINWVGLEYGDPRFILVSTKFLLDNESKNLLKKYICETIKYDNNIDEYAKFIVYNSETEL